MGDGFRGISSDRYDLALLYRNFLPVRVRACGFCGMRMVWRLPASANAVLNFLLRCVASFCVRDVLHACRLYSSSS